jgi:gamma-glutamylcyclotransferase (GGCT)/AIG2-like uncharacterized protein YtfP
VISGAERREAHCTLLFVYGTLRSDSGHPMHEVLARGAVLVGRGTVGGALVDLGEYPGLVLDRDGSTPGEVWRVRDATLWATLDAYEGIGPDAEVTESYERVRVHVRLDDGTDVEAWTYAWRS